MTWIEAVVSMHFVVVETTSTWQILSACVVLACCTSGKPAFNTMLMLRDAISLHSMGLPGLLTTM